MHVSNYAATFHWNKEFSVHTRTQLWFRGVSLPKTNLSSYWTMHLRNYIISPWLSLFPQWEKKRFLRLVTKIIVRTSWGGVTMLCVRCPDHLSITQGSWGRGWGTRVKDQSCTHTHTHTHTHCHSSEAWLTKATAKNEASQDRFTHK